MSPIRLLTFSTLFPNCEQPNHGIFVENRLRHLLAGSDVTSTVLAPVAYFPSRSPRFGAWSQTARVPPCETRHGLAVHHPRYLSIPRFGMTAAPFLLYQAAARALARLLRAGLHFDAIDAHYFYPDGVAAVWLGRRFGLPVVITARGSDISLLPRYAAPRRLIGGAIAGTAAIIAVSAALKEALIALGAAPERVTVLRNGVETGLFRPTDRTAARAALGLSRPTLISVGHLIERKGHDRVIEALRLLPGYDLIILGEGPERARLEALIARHALGARARLLGAQPHARLAEFYTAADALVLASSREGWANVLLEAMACGTPVVASNIWGNPEVVRDHAAGLIMRHNTPEGIAEGVQRLFANPPRRPDTRAYAEGFSWDETTAGQVEIFRRVVGTIA
jgi:glycosyltransferase involved in cell wall biosynthesis